MPHRAQWLKRDLLVWLLLPLLAIVAAAGALGTYTAQRLTDQVYDRWLLDAAQSVATLVRFDGAEARVDLPVEAEAVLLFDETDRTYFSVMQGERLLAGRRDLPEQGQDESVYARGRAYEARIDNQPVRIVQVDDIPVPSALAGDGASQGVRVRVAETLAKRQHSRQELMLMLWPMGTLVLAAAVAIVLAVGRTVRPLQTIAARWGERSQASLEPIAEHDVPRELLPFTTALNGLLTRIREMLVRERQFAATAAHQLRTPLAGLQLGLTRAAEAPDLPGARAVIGELSQATQRTGRLVQQLLALGGLDPETRGNLDAHPTDLLALARDVGAAHADQAIAKHIDLELSAPHAATTVTVSLHADLMAEALSNLIDNAIRYTPAGGRTMIEVMAGPPRLVVSDSGPGIAPDERQIVFERFVRGRHATGEGSGLGLAIVREIVSLHSARLVLDEGAWGGARITITFGEAAAEPSAVG